MITYVGIDPGASGGLVALGETESIISMPKTERDVWDWFRKLRGQPLIAVIEVVHSMPKQGVVSSFKFGSNYGSLRMAAIAASTFNGLVLDEVSPQQWQRAIGISSRGRTESKAQYKDRLRAKAQQLFPQKEVWAWGKTKQLTVCDALLIAHYCRLRYGAKR